MKTLPLLLLVLTLGFGATAGAEEARDNLVRFQVQVGESVINDRLQVVLRAQQEAPESSAAAEVVNGLMQEAIATAKEMTAVKVRSGSYHTQPLYDRDRLRGWRVYQDLILESEAIAELSDLTGKLQARLEVISMHFSVSEERARDVEERLIEQALTAFRERAELVSQGLQAERYRLIDVNINSGRDYVPPVPRGAIRTMEASVRAPALEAGESRQTVSVQGTIQLY